MKVFGLTVENPKDYAYRLACRDIVKFTKTEKMKSNTKQQGVDEAEKQRAGDAWKNYIKQFPELEKAWYSIPEPANIWLSQQIDIFAGKYPTAVPVEGLRWVKASERLPAIQAFPCHIPFREISTRKMLDVYSYWSDTHLELGDADYLGKAVGTLVEKSNVEWLEQPVPTKQEEELK